MHGTTTSHSTASSLTTTSPNGTAHAARETSARRDPLARRLGLGASGDRAADDRGAATAEYAIATMAAVGFASLLVVIMQSDEVRGILTDLVRTALTVGG
ncbi:MAG: DUF4244 domain-containing protein [Microbacterium sp.]|nr:DUF4244 domain-containing protein [Microbacterium sp.]MBA4346005.1 DUF4244 domain-containing protein [Microbacterium sp.]